MSGTTIPLLEDRSADPAVHLAVFGKHPCAADHLEDLGMTTASLAAFKQLFYVEGIGQNLARSRWPDAASPNGLPWAHWIFCAGPQGFLVARCTAGEDSRNRRQYPLVLAAHVARADWIDQAPRLDFLASAADSLRLESSRQGLERVRQETLARLREWTLQEIPGTTARRRFAGSGPAERTGIVRVLHALHHGGLNPEARMATDTPPLEAAAHWAALIRSCLPRCRVATVALADRRPDIVEAFPTPPLAGTLRNLFPAPGSGPPALTTNVEFAIDPAFAAAANAAIDAWIDPPASREPAAAPLLTRLSRLFRRG